MDYYFEARVIDDKLRSAGCPHSTTTMSQISTDPRNPAKQRAFSLPNTWKREYDGMCQFTETKLTQSISTTPIQISLAQWLHSVVRSLRDHALRHLTYIVNSWTGYDHAEPVSSSFFPYSCTYKF